MKNLALFFLILGLFFAVSAQSKNKKNARPAEKTTSAEPSPTQTPAPENTPPGKTPQKKNARDESAVKPPAVNTSKVEEAKNYYRYEFSQPNFLIKEFVIEHDETGRGTITFKEKNFDESVTDNLQLSSVTLEKINKLLTNLNFLDSEENYQSTLRNYPHLGEKKVRFKTGGKDRTVEFNWTENADAKALGDEYSKIGYQFVWQSDMKVARENQPLETPGLVDVLDSYLKRGEISDPVQMLPLLKELSNDERLPLLARNHVLRLIKDIEKQGKSKK